MIKNLNSRLNSLGSILNHLNEGSVFLCLDLKRNWEAILGPRLGSMARPIGYKNKCLFIRLPSACHVQEISFEKEEILSRLNQHLGGRAVIEDLHLTW